MFAFVWLPQLLLLPIKRDMGYGSFTLEVPDPPTVFFCLGKMVKPDTSWVTICYEQLVIPHPVEEIQWSVQNHIRCFIWVYLNWLAGFLRINGGWEYINKSWQTANKVLIHTIVPLNRLEEMIVSAWTHHQEYLETLTGSLSPQTTKIELVGQLDLHSSLYYPVCCRDFINLTR